MCIRDRADYLQKACDILMREKSADTVCGWVRNIGRDGQESKVLTLGELRNEQVDMFTTVSVSYTHLVGLQNCALAGRWWRTAKACRHWPGVC